MREYWRTEGIILKKRDRGEADRVFTVFTKDFGKFDVWATSERKSTSKLRGGLEILYLSEIEFIQGKSKKTITDVFLLEAYQDIRGSLKKLQVAFRIAETLDMFCNGEYQDIQIWNLLKESLNILDSSTRTAQQYSLIYYYFFWNLVSYLGWKPRFNEFELTLSNILKTFLSQDISHFLGLNSEKFSLPALHKISKEYFLKVQKELH